MEIIHQINLGADEEAMINSALAVSNSMVQLSNEKGDVLTVTGDGKISFRTYHKDRFITFIGNKEGNVITITAEDSNGYR